jgi:hypothetical protein
MQRSRQTSKIEPRHRHRHHPKVPVGPVGRPASPPLPLHGLRTGMTTIITNPYDNPYVYLQIRRTCAAGCAIGPRDVSSGGTFSRVRYRQATHRRAKCAAICAISVRYVAYSGTFRSFFDERTHDRTHQNPRNRRTNPRYDLSHPKARKPRRRCVFSTRAPVREAPRPGASNPRRATLPNDPRPCLTPARLSAIIPMADAEHRSQVTAAMRLWSFAGSWRRSSYCWWTKRIVALEKASSPWASGAMLRLASSSAMRMVR